MSSGTVAVAANAPLTAETLTGILTSDAFIDTMGSRLIARIAPRVQPILTPIISSLPMASSAAASSIGSGFSSIVRGFTEGIPSILGSAGTFMNTLGKSVAQAQSGSQPLVDAVAAAPSVPGGTQAVSTVLKVTDSPSTSSSTTTSTRGNTTTAGTTTTTKKGGRRTVRAYGKKHRMTRRR